MNRKLLLLIPVLILLSSFVFGALPATSDIVAFYIPQYNETGSTIPNAETYPPWVSLKDWASSSFDATAYGGVPLISPSGTNASYDFDGSADYNILPTRNFGLSNGDDFSFEIDFYPHDVTSPQYILTNYEGSSNWLRSAVGISSGKVYVETADSANVNYKSTRATISANSWYRLAGVIYGNGTQPKLYLSAVEQSGDYIQGGTLTTSYIDNGLNNYYIATRDQLDRKFNGEIAKVVIYNKSLSQAEVTSLSEQDRTYNPLDEPEPTEIIRKESLYQVTQGDVVTITLNDTWTTIFQWNYSLEENFTNYGSTTFQTLSNTQNTNFTCRTVINGNATGDDVSRTNIPGQIGSLTTLRPDINISGNYEGETQCRKNGGTTFVGFANGIGHVFDQNVVSFNIVNNVFINGTNVIIDSFPFTPPYDGALIFESSGTLVSNISQNVSVFTNASNGQSCAPVVRSTGINNTGAVGGICAIQVEGNVTINLSLVGTGQEAYIYDLTHVKVLSNANSTALYGVNVTESQTLIGRVLVDNTARLDKVFMHSGISIKDSGQTVSFQFDVDGVLQAQAIPYTAGNEIKQSIQQYLGDAPDKDYFNVSIYATADAVPVTDIEIVGGNIIAYVGDEYNIDSKFINVTAKNLWNDTSLTNFSVFDGFTNYTTDDGIITIFAPDSLINLTFYAEDYLPRTYLSHNTTSNLEGSIYQSIVTINAETITSGQSIDAFTINLSNGSQASTTNGTAYAFPNIGNYSWNASATGYYNIFNVEANVTNSSENLVISDFYDSYAIFQNADTSEGIVNASVTLTYLNGSTYDLTTGSIGEISFAGYRIGGYNSYNLTLEATQGYITPITFAENISDAALPSNETYSISLANLTISVRDATTEALITQNVTITINGVGTQYTTTGIVSLENVTLASGPYTIYVYTNNYTSNQKTFIFTNQEELNVTIYLIPLDEPNRGTIFVNVYDSFLDFVTNADLRLQIQDPVTASFEEISQRVSSSSGTAAFDVILNENVYRVYGQYTKDGITYEGYSTLTGEVFYVDGQPVPIYLDTIAAVPDKEYNFLVVNTTNRELVGNVSFHQVDFFDSAGLDHEVCLAYSYMNGLVKTLSEEICIFGSSGTINAEGGYLLDRSFTWIVETYIKEGNYKRPEYSQTYSKEKNLASVFSFFIKFIIMALIFGALAWALYINKIQYFVYLLVALTIIWLIATPSIVKAWLLVAMIVFGWLAINMSKIKTGLGAD